jgi:hypothetical protein
MKSRNARVIGVALGLLGGAGWAEEQQGTRPAPPRTHRVVAGPQYKANLVHRLVYGTGYRNLWATPIQVEVLDLGTFSGGLTPEKKTGGKQTKGLRFKAADGSEWKFRSVNKDPSEVLPAALREGPIDDIVQDQISASLPAGTLVADALADAAGILHVSQRLLVMPDDARLGEFRKEFAGMLGTMEEVPRVEPPVTAGFQGFTKLVETDDLVKLVDADSAERVDAREFLRARLLDVLMGDYDRHSAQWDWARGQNGRWVPVPRDRDLAFVKFDGMVLDLARRAVPRLVDFEDSYPSPVALGWASRSLDRRYLSDLDWPAWQAMVDETQGRLSDRVIDQAFRRLPAPYYEKAGPALAGRLKIRRDRLDEFARRFYEMLAHEAEVYGSDQVDNVQLLRDGDGSVEVVASGPQGPYYRRKFDDDDTREVRVFLKDGDDRTISEGRESPGVKVRLVGGEGNDVLDDSAGGHTRFYDSSGENQVIEGPGTRKNTRPYTAPLDRNERPERDWGSATRILPWFRGGGGYGLVLGVALEQIDYGFRKHPYSHRHALRLGYSTERQAGGVHYDYESLRTDNRSRFDVHARASALEVIHFYGFGNETFRGERSFHDVEQTRFVLAPSYRLDLTPVDVTLGPVVKFSDTRLPDDTLIGLQQPYGVGRFGQAGARLGFRLDRRDDPDVSLKGVLLAAEGTYYPQFWDAEEGFGVVHGQLAVIVPLGFPALALRAGGQQVFGTYPFHETAYLGGGETVRGLPRQRYGGDASVYGNAELRLPLRRRPGSMLPSFGLFGLADGGRVFLEGESSDRWHTSYGGGVWLSVVGHTMSVSVARSEGHVRVYLQGGLLF